MRIGFLSVHNPHDRLAFSGTAHFLAAALGRAPGVDLRILGRHPRSALIRRAGRRLGVPWGGRLRARDLEGLDWVICLVSTGLVLEAARLGRARVVHVTDATPRFLREFYGMEIGAEAEAAEAEAVRRADLVLYSSGYMAERAAAEFAPAAGGRIAAVPFGVNLDDLPAAPARKGPLAPLRLLFVGRDWERKGGAVALSALDALRARGVAARLTVIGCTDPAAEGREDVELLGRLDKNRAADRRRLDAAFRAAHLFLLPTRADCTPMVVAEANAHATPVLITRTGGVPALMREGVNGAMLPPEAGGAAWADRILDLTRDAGAYRALCRSSFTHYRDRLNWDAWARDVRALLEEGPQRVS